MCRHQLIFALLWGLTINLRDQLKRIEIFSRDQRLIVIAAVFACVAGVGLLYYTPYQVLLLPVVIGLNYSVLRRLLVSKRRSRVFAKLIRPSLWLLLLFSYIFTIHIIFLIPIVWFTILSLLICLGYGLLLWQEVQTEPNILLDNTLSLILLTFGVSLASLLVAYWHLPGVLVMIGLWLVMFFLAITWLLDFTDSPYVLASVWSLITIEIFWITTRWVNLYHVPKTALLVSQTALTVAALAYSFGGMYYHYKNKTLRRSLIFEYIGVTLVVFIALMLLSKWAVVL